jgi:MFS family permease
MPMNQAGAKRRVYFGWYIVAIAVLVNTALIGTTYSIFALLVLPVSTEFNLSRADMNTTLILLMVGNTVFAPFIGRMVDRFPLRRIMIGFAILYGVSLAGLGVSSSPLVSAAIVVAPLSAALLGSGTLTMTVLVGRWFVAQRGRALALAALGLSTGGFIVAPAAGLLIGQVGWRLTLVSLAAAGTVLTIALALVVRDRPAPGESESGEVTIAAPDRGADAPKCTPAKVSTLLTNPRFWAISVSTALAASIVQGVSISIVPLALENGMSMLRATTLVSAAAGASIAGKLLLSVIADKVDRFLLLTVMFLLGSVVNALLLTGTGYYMLLGCAVFLGLATGAMMPAFYALLADQFGIENFGTVRGMSVPIFSVINAVALRFAGEIYDRTGNYDVLFMAFVGAELLAAVLIFASRSPARPPARESAPS